jgi:alpha-L-rhamnosidase
MNFKSIVVILTILMGSFLVFAAGNATQVTALRVEYKTNPIGIGTTSPRFFWKMTSDVPGQLQTAYQVLVASTPGKLAPGKADLWDSKKVVSDQSIQLAYQGKPLESRQKCYWTVKVWDKDGKEIKGDSPAYFEMGLLKTGDWQADWIRSAQVFHVYSYPSPLLRKEFTLAKKVKSAHLYVTSLGLYEFRLNGLRVGDEVFTPGWTSFKNRLQYQVFDVTGMLTPGNNAAGIMLGNGWYRVFNPNSNRNGEITPLEVLAQLEIEFSDGSKKVVKTDNSWKASTGAIIKSEIFNGEVYDARLEKSGWDKSGFDDRNWPGTEVVSREKTNLVSAVSEPVRRIEELSPVKILYTPGGDTVVDMGQNMVGWCRLTLNCPAGTTIKLRHAEVLDKKGNFYTENLRTAKQEIVYTCKGGGEEVYEPHFTFQGFRYVDISGYPKQVTTDMIRGIVVHSDLERTGSFSCNEPLINQLQHNIIWGQKGNFLGVPTDCPQRNERLGWTGDAQVFAPTACFNMNSAGFFTKWLYDLAVDQHEDGAVPHVIPNVLGRGGSSGWADAAVVVPWVMYRSYGDTRILEEQFASMKKWVEFMRKEAGDTYLFQPKDRQFGDWLAFATIRSDYPGATTDKDFLSSAYFYHSADLLRQMAEILGKKQEVADYGKLQKNIKEAFIKEFVTSNGRLSSNTQTAYVVALSFGLLPPDLEKNAASRLAKDVNNFGHLTTGFLGAADICHVLARYGYIAEAYKLIYRKEYPSWLYPVTKGATTIWERWDGIKPDSTFQNAGMNSFNHYAYGAVGDWLYKMVAGINAGQSGYKSIVIKPFPGGNMNDVTCTHETLYGPVSSAWKITENRFVLSVTIPANTSADISVPSTGRTLKQNGTDMAHADWITPEGTPYGFLKTRVGSGNYVFETTFSPAK